MIEFFISIIQPVIVGIILIYIEYRYFNKEKF